MSGVLEADFVSGVLDVVRAGFLRHGEQAPQCFADNGETVEVILFPFPSDPAEREAALAKVRVIVAELGTFQCVTVFEGYGRNSDDGSRAEMLFALAESVAPWESGELWYATVHRGSESVMRLGRWCRCTVLADWAFKLLVGRW